MKKLFRKLVAGIMVLGCVFAMIGCAPKLNIKDAEDALRAKDYEVEIDYEETEIDGIELLEKSLYAERGDAWIEIYEFKDKKTAKLYYEVQKTTFDNAVKSAEEWIEFYEYVLDKNRDTLTSSEINEIEDEIKEYKKEIEELKKNFECIGVNGKYLWYASHKDVIDDAK